jgi:hypothetical protein
MDDILCFFEDFWCDGVIPLIAYTIVSVVVLVGVSIFLPDEYKKLAFIPSVASMFALAEFRRARGD